MGSVLLSMLVAGATIAPGGRMFVIMHTSDRVVVDYVCMDRLVLGEGGAIRRVVQKEGGYTWNVVGGVAPYQVIMDDQHLYGSVCITVIDAIGNMARGCGTIELRRHIEEVGCTCNEGALGLIHSSPASQAKDTTACKPHPIRGRISTRATPRDQDRDRGTRSTTPVRVVERKTSGGAGGGQGQPVQRSVRR